jgi:luciferase family oxidoreductase group 1
MPTPADITLSVLDISPIVQGSTAREALANSVNLARFADELGYHRYWVPEHHSMRGVASAAPAVLVGQLAAVTSRMRVGSGGVLLYNHAPMVVAEQFGTLEALHHGRIDLGIGRSLGGTTHTAERIRSDAARTARTFDEQLGELLDFFDPGPEQKIRAIPAVGNCPPVWLLGSTEYSARLAGSLGLAYAFAMHLNPKAVDSALRLYRDSFRASRRAIGVPAPTLLVSVPVIAADSDERARWLAGSNKLKFLGRRLGKRMLLPSPNDAARYPYTDDDLASIDGHFADTIVGDPDTVMNGLTALVERTGVSELMITTQVFDHSDRRRSYELIAQSARQSPQLQPATR